MINPNQKNYNVSTTTLTSGLVAISVVFSWFVSFFVLSRFWSDPDESGLILINLVHNVIHHDSS